MAKLTTDRTEKVMRMFSDKVIREAKRNLGSKGSGKLKETLNYDLKVYPSGGLELSFTSAEHAKYVDKGVRGASGKPHPGSSYTAAGSEIRAKNSPYKFLNKMPPRKAIDKWVVRKNLTGTRDAKGRFKKRKGLVIGIQRRIYLYGLEETKFFTQPFLDNFKKLPKDFIRAYARDVAKFLRITTAEIFIQAK